MPKITFTATDAAGTVHKRTSDRRNYTHTVVRRGGYELALRQAADASWTKTDARNFAFYQQIASGNDQYANKHYPVDWQSAEENERRRLQVIAANEKRVADAKAAVEGHNTDTYVAFQRATRVARVEQAKANGYFERWNNRGWCGRLDLAQKLAARDAEGGAYETAILEAKEA